MTLLNCVLMQCDIFVEIVISSDERVIFSRMSHSMCHIKDNLNYFYMNATQYSWVCLLVILQWQTFKITKSKNHFWTCDIFVEFSQRLLFICFDLFVKIVVINYERCMKLLVLKYKSNYEIKFKIVFICSYFDFICLKGF